MNRCPENDQRRRVSGAWGMVLGTFAAKVPRLRGAPREEKALCRRHIKTYLDVPLTQWSVLTGYCFPCEKFLYCRGAPLHAPDFCREKVSKTLAHVPLALHLTGRKAVTASPVITRVR